MATMTVSKSKFGFHPCDYETFRKLKFLNLKLLEAKRQRARWVRWERKEPHNRMERQRLRNSKGQVVAYGLKVPMDEPELEPLFCDKREIKVYYDRSGKYVKDGMLRPIVDLLDYAIEDNYRLARFPAANELEVSPLTISVEKINELYQLLV